MQFLAVITRITEYSREFQNDALWDILWTPYLSTVPWLNAKSPSVGYPSDTRISTLTCSAPLLLLSLLSFLLSSLPPADDEELLLACDPLSLADDDEDGAFLVPPRLNVNMWLCRSESARIDSFTMGIGADISDLRLRPPSKPPSLHNDNKTFKLHFIVVSKTKNWDQLNILPVKSSRHLLRKCANHSYARQSSMQLYQIKSQYTIHLSKKC